MTIIDYVGQYLPLGEGIWGWFGIAGYILGIVMLIFYTYMIFKTTQFRKDEEE